jgi:hypothetical protein
MSSVTHTASSQSDPVRGTGAATSWVFDQMQSFAATSNGSDDVVDLGGHGDPVRNRLDEGLLLYRHADTVRVDLPDQGPEIGGGATVRQGRRGARGTGRRGAASETMGAATAATAEAPRNARRLVLLRS